MRRGPRIEIRALYALYSDAFACIEKQHVARMSDLSAVARRAKAEATSGTTLTLRRISLRSSGLLANSVGRISEA